MNTLLHPRLACIGGCFGCSFFMTICPRFLQMAAARSRAPPAVDRFGEKSQLWVLFTLSPVPCARALAAQVRLRPCSAAGP
jgi:hypothetical protein